MTTEERAVRFDRYGGREVPVMQLGQGHAHGKIVPIP